MSDETITHVFSVRGRPVGFQASRFSGALVAVERGYFPASPSGYRSLSGLSDFAAVSAEFLEYLARERDRERARVLTELRRVPRPGRDRLADFIGLSLTVTSAVSDGFFAPDAERAALWGGAYRLLCRIDTDSRFQPAPTAPAWTPEHCAIALERHRELLCFVRQLATGEWPDEPSGPYFGARAYFHLPPRPGGEPPFILPAVTPELALDLPPASPGDEEEVEPDGVLAVPADETGENPDQLTLF